MHQYRHPPASMAQIQTRAHHQHPHPYLRTLSFAATLSRGFTLLYPSSSQAPSTRTTRLIYLFPIFSPMDPACPAPTPTTSTLGEIKFRFEPDTCGQSSWWTSLSPSKYPCLEIHLSPLFAPANPVPRSSSSLRDSDPRRRVNPLDLGVSLVWQR
ncbi:hypothetical protein EDD16DRAFT_38852 [Pisolithus croceorrhizus]|nr:hypothetical protein EDD16DRAFT_38852 [Pisolithus croceorrhizus]